MTGRDRTYLRGQLASVGILLEPATMPSSAEASQEAPAKEPRKGRRRS